MDARSPAIDIQQATVWLENQEILHCVTLSLAADEHVAIVGPNGSGKSTLIKLLSGDVYPLHRDEPAPIRVFGQSRWDLFELRSKLGIVSNALQERYHRATTGLDVVLSGFFGSIGTYGHQAISEAMTAKARETLRFLGINHLEDKQIVRMSSGEARRFLIGRALVHDPLMLVLDEPYSSLDLKARALFADVVRKVARRGHSLVLVTHALEEIPPEIERVVLMKQGMIFADGPKDRLLRSATISELFDMPVRVVREGETYHAFATTDEHSALP